MKEQITVSFPGLGIEDFSVSKIAVAWQKLPFYWGIVIALLSVAAALGYGLFRYKKKGRLVKDEVLSVVLIAVFGALIGVLLCFINVSVRWYGLLITVGMGFAVGYTFFRAKRIGVSTDDLLDLALFTILFGVLGARLYYVITYGGYSFAEIFQIWRGGLAIYGGIIGGILAIFFVCRRKKLNFLGMIDCIGPGVMIAQAIGRWGNFFNGEAYGGIVEEGSALYFLRMGLYPNKLSFSMAYVHPTFLYESLWNVVGFVLINVFYKKKRFDGEIAFWYLSWYGFGRMLIEGLRTDSLMVGSFRISQLVGLLCFLGCGGLAVWGRIRSYKKRATPEKTEENEDTNHGETH